MGFKRDLIARIKLKGVYRTSIVGVGVNHDEAQQFKNTGEY